MSYLDSLNEVQRQAVTEIDGPVLIVAGPGSGKTRVLTYRIAHLIHSGIAPWEILSLTFTNKAAKEMKSRIASVVGNKADKIWAGTFHSVFARILRFEAEKIGFPSSFSIYDTQDSQSLISTIVKEMNLDGKIYSSSAIRSRISSAKSKLITPKAYSTMEDLIAADRLAGRPRVHQIYQKYVNRCATAGAMDFDDLLLQLFRLFYQNPDNVLEKYQKKFKHVLVDEFQDTNHLQYAILKKLMDYRLADGKKDPYTPRNITVVGDDAQSIYAFRGATIDNILDFEKDYKPFGIKVFKLEQNYRSTAHIVQAANEVISNNEKQIPKKIWSHKGAGRKIQLIRTVDDGNEGRRVADLILEQKTRYHLSNSDIAILYRTNAQSRIFEEHLRRQNLNYKIFGGISFYQRKEVKDLTAYLRLVVNPKDEEALKRVINYPKRGIGPGTIAKIAATAAQIGTHFYAAIPHTKLPARASKTLGEFVKMINAFRSKQSELDAFELASMVARKTKMIDLLKADHSPEGQSRQENITALLDGIKEFTESDELFDEDVITDDKSLASFLQSIALYSDQDEEEEDGEFITLMSVHAAKGLEFRSVFVVGLEEDLFPSFMAKNDLNGMDEERRLFYVAITRAEEFLVLTYSERRFRFGKLKYPTPSPFLSEISEDHLDSYAPVVKRREPTINEAPITSGVQGNFSRVQRVMPTLMADPSTFRPSPTSELKVGMKVLHLKFGKGEIILIDGSEGNQVATIRFDQIGDVEKRIMLKFAKLQIL